MSGFANFKAYGDARTTGQYQYSTFRKTPSQATTVGVWFDLSMSPGNPKPQYYAASPLVAQPMSHSSDFGLFHGGAPGSGRTKHLAGFTIMSNSATGLPAPMMVLDYLMFYPFVDEGTTDPQPMTNIATLPRYTNGAGVQVMAVSVAPRSGGQTFNISYTNQDGVAGRTSATVIQNTAASSGSIVSCAVNSAFSAGPFIPLQAGDTGVRSIESVTMISGTDVGLFTLVLVRPIAQACLLEQTAPVEYTYVTDTGTLPVIEDDAYLNLICCPQGSLSNVGLFGDLTTVWN